MLVEPRRFSERHVGRVLANLEIHKVLIAPSFVKSPVWIGDVQNLDQCSPKRQVEKTKPPALKLFHFAGIDVDVSQPV